MYKVGDKFIIEIGEKYESEFLDSNNEANIEQKESPIILYRIKGFNSLVFDENGLKKLSPFNKFDVKADILESAEKDGYEKGLQDAWECVKKISLNPEDGGMFIWDVKDAFSSESLQDILKDFAPQEAIDKLKAREEKQEIKVGDVVRYGVGNFLLTVTKIYGGDEELFDGVRTNGEAFNYRKLSDCKKTGKHIDLTEIFKGLEEEDV